MKKLSFSVGLLFMIISLLFAMGCSNGTPTNYEETTPDNEYLVPGMIYVEVNESFWLDGTNGYDRFFSEFESVELYEVSRNRGHGSDRFILSFNHTLIEESEFFQIISNHPHVHYVSYNLRLLNWENDWIVIYPDVTGLVTNFNIEEFIDSYSIYGLKFVMKSGVFFLFSFNRNEISEIELVVLLREDQNLIWSELYTLPGWFDDQSLIVTLEGSDLPDKSFFGEVAEQILEVEPLYMKPPAQIMLVLNKNDVKNVVNVVEYVKQLDGVVRAGYNFYIPPAWGEQ